MLQFFFYVTQGDTQEHYNDSEKSNNIIMVSETAEHFVSTPPPSVTNTANMLPPARRNRSEAWDHFTPHPQQGTSKSAKCNYCGSMIKYDNGTSAMRAHLGRCKDNPNALNRRHDSASSSVANAEGVVSSSPSFPKFDQDVSRIDLVNMFIAMEIPFRQVEHPYFRKFVYGLQPRFNVLSRTTLARDILRHWDTEKTRLKMFLSQHCQRVCLTTDTWTSTQDFNYMCLTAHFIDKNWKLQKRILNFCQVTDYSGQAMAQTIDKYLSNWGLTRVPTVTVDNASSNDAGIRHLKSGLQNRNGLVLNGDYLHMRCCAHILNLIVKEGLKDIDDSVLRIRAAVKYVRRSPARFDRFKKCIDEQNIGYKGFVGLDCETRWNSTYTMLNAALKHRKTFDELYFRDQKYVNELNMEKGVPKNEDWEHVDSILPFLEMFYKATLRISGSSYLTSNLYMFEVLGIGKEIAEQCDSVDEKVSSMAKKMKTKYDKYWGKPANLNMLLLIALVLDPRRKFKFVAWMVNRIYNSDDAASLKAKLESCLKSIYEEYSSGLVSPLGNSTNQSDAFDEVYDDPYGCSEFYQTAGCSTSNSELSQYIQEDLEKRPLDFDILAWWKVNSSRFPILASIAREVLAIPISTVASESAFSTGGRILDPYRSSLTPTMVEALVCTQDWLEESSSSYLPSNDFEFLEQLEQELPFAQDVASCSVSIALDDD